MKIFEQIVIIFGNSERIGKTPEDCKRTNTVLFFKKLTVGVKVGPGNNRSDNLTLIPRRILKQIIYW